MTTAERERLMGLVKDWNNQANVEDSMRWNAYYEGRTDALDNCAAQLRALVAEMGERDGND